MTNDERTKFHVYECIVNVSEAIAKEGIAKDRKNDAQGYRFRGIDDVYNALAPLLAKHKLVILPRMLSREVVERVTKTGGVLFSVTVEAEFDFVSAVDGSTHTVKTYGEAMDSGDKATNKAMSAAYKYAAFQTFCIPTEGDNDADATTHQVAPHPAKAQNLPRGEVSKNGSLFVRAVTSRQGATNGKAWTLHLVTFSDGRSGSTFSKDIADGAQSCLKSEAPVDIVLVPGKKPGAFQLTELARVVEREPGVDG